MTGRRLLTLFAALAALLVGVLPPAAACPVDAQTPHTCCQPTTTRPATPSCCSESVQHHPSQRSTTELGCRCAHGTTVPAALETTPPGQTDQSEIGDGDGTPTIDLRAPEDLAVIGSSGPDRKPPPPLYLLACAFLN